MYYLQRFFFVLLSYVLWSKYNLFLKECCQISNIIFSWHIIGKEHCKEELLSSTWFCFPVQTYSIQNKLALKHKQS